MVDQLSFSFDRNFRRFFFGLPWCGLSTTTLLNWTFPKALTRKCQCRIWGFSYIFSSFFYDPLDPPPSLVHFSHSVISLLSSSFHFYLFILFCIFIWVFISLQQQACIDPLPLLHPLHTMWGIPDKIECHTSRHIFFIIFFSLFIFLFFFLFVHFQFWIDSKFTVHNLYRVLSSLDGI